ncbi:MAG: hypothetical protein KF760_20370 [Candidatus Eremiobacteraeota bacterium]|nr:hypothetical protein [Candidatus Eremiobacteraeota bacterium]MCW5872173.1 hypothetical protein [Candidatus Eremiobacteraeota bacterium]
MSLAWFGIAPLWATEGNDCFTRWAFHYGVILSMALAFFSGWLYHWVGYHLVSFQHRKNAAYLSALIFVPLLALLGSGGLSEIWASQADPDYYRRNGVGPVNIVALLAQSAGIFMSWFHYWRSRKRTEGALSWVDSESL